MFLGLIFPVQDLWTGELDVSLGLFATPWTVAHQAALAMGFPSPRDLLEPGIKPMSPTLAGGFSTTESPGKPEHIVIAR